MPCRSVIDVLVHINTKDASKLLEIDIKGRFGERLDGLQRLGDMTCGVELAAVCAHDDTLGVHNVRFTAAEETEQIWLDLACDARGANGDGSGFLAAMMCWQSGVPRKRLHC